MDPGSMEESDSNSAVLDTIAELLQLHDTARKDAEQRADELRAAEREISVQNHALAESRDEVTRAEEETRKWRLQLDLMRDEHRAEKSQLMKQNKGLEKLRAQLQGKDSQYNAKLRKVEGEVSRMKDQLQKAQNPSKGRKDRAGISMVRVLPAATRTVSGRRPGSEPIVSESQRLLEEAHAAYTETLSELRSENQCLRSSLQALQEDLTDACNDFINPGRRDMTRSSLVEGDTDAGAAALRGTMLLPVDLMQDGMEQQIRQLVQSVRELLTSAASADDRSIPLESPSLAQMAAASLAELREQLSEKQAETARLHAALMTKNDRLADTERMCALLRDAAHKQLGASAAAEAIRLREEACDQRESALEAEAAAVAEQTESNAIAAADIDKQRAALEADAAAVAASLSAWERGSVGPDGTPLAGKGSAAATDASPYVAQFLRRLSGISAPASASKLSPAGVNPRGSARRGAKMTITPHKTSTLPMFSPKATPLAELNKQFANTLNHSVPTVSPRNADTATGEGRGGGAHDCSSPSRGQAGSSGLNDMDGDEAAQPDLSVDEMMSLLTIEDASNPDPSTTNGDRLVSEADKDAQVVDGGVGERDFSKLMAAAGITNR